MPCHVTPARLLSVAYCQQRANPSPTGLCRPVCLVTVVMLTLNFDKHSLFTIMSTLSTAVTVRHSRQLTRKNIPTQFCFLTTVLLYSQRFVLQTCLYSCHTLLKPAPQRFISITAVRCVARDTETPVCDMNFISPNMAAQYNIENKIEIQNMFVMQIWYRICLVQDSGDN